MTSIFLVGMMGCGKTTVGRRLATRRGLAFIDVDKEMEQRCGVAIPTIFDLEGEAGFRRRESMLIDELTRRPSVVLATGGGAVLLPENRGWLRERGVVVYLKASPSDLWQRLKHDRQRPLLQTEDPRKRIGDLVALRDPLYLQTAHHVVRTGRQPVDRVVDAILVALDAGPAAKDDDRTSPAAGAAPDAPR